MLSAPVADRFEAARMTVSAADATCLRDTFGLKMMDAKRLLQHVSLGGRFWFNGSTSLAQHPRVIGYCRACGATNVHPEGDKYPMAVFTG